MTITLQKVGRLANVAWIVLVDGKESGLSIVPGSFDRVTKGYTTSIVFTSFKVQDFRAGQNGKIIAEGLATKPVAQARAAAILAA